jgi:hypothetical protein
MTAAQILIPRLPFPVKIGGLFFIIMYVAVFFSIIYWKIFDKSYVDAFCNSLSIQTIGGNRTPATTSAEKVVTATQSLIAFMLLNGMLVISLTHK